MMTDGGRREMRNARETQAEAHAAAGAAQAETGAGRQATANADRTETHANRDAERRERTGMKLMRLMMIAAALSFMSVHLFNIVVPEISRQFGITLAQASWLSSGYTLIYGFGTVVWGKLADRYRLRPIITAGLLVFTAGSLAGLLSQSFWTALAGRLLQAAGASVVPAMAMMLPIRYFAPERRGSAISMTAVGLAIGGVLGPVVASLLLSIADWRWLFVPSLLMLALLPPFRRFLAEGEPAGSAGSAKPDAFGGGLLFTATATLLLGLTWWNAWLFAAFAAALGLFILHIRRAREPFVRPDLFGNRLYRTGLIMTALITAASNGVFLLSPMLLSDVYGLESRWIGFALVPAAFASALLGRFGGRLADRKGSAVLYAAAAGLLIACFALLALLAGTLPVLAIPLILVPGNVGQTFMQVAITNSVSRTLPKAEAGVGMGLFSMTNFLSTSAAAGLYGAAVEAGRSGVLPGWPGQAPDIGAFGLIYAALAALHLALLAVYRLSFGAGAAHDERGESRMTEGIGRPDWLEEVNRWPGVTTAPHRFGGTAFLVNGREIGHTHGLKLVDIPLSKAARDEAIARGKASPHHIHPASNWVTVRITDSASAANALQLLRLNYERLLAAQNGGAQDRV